MPHTFAREAVELRYTATVVEGFCPWAERIALHRRIHQAGSFSTVPEHMTKSHRDHLEWSPTRLIQWGQAVGPNTEALITAILEDRPHPEQGYPSCLGILRLDRKYGKERLESACERAVRFSARSNRNVESNLKNGLDRESLPDQEPEQVKLPTAHKNVRGGDYYR